jgi:hypothetical protein
VVARLRVRSTHENLGCERKPDREWCRLRLESGEEGWAAAEFLSPLTLGNRAKDGNYDRLGRLSCAEADGSNMDRCEYGATFEDDRAIVSVFVDRGAPVVLHFRGGEFDSSASFGPFSTESGDPQRTNDAVSIVAMGVRLEIPKLAIQP